MHAQERSLRQIVWLIGAIIFLSLTGCQFFRPPQEATQRPTPKVSQSPSPSQSPANNTAQSSAIARMEQDTIQQINQNRQQQNLEPLSRNTKLTQVARDYSRRMAKQDFFSHTSPDGDTIAQRVQSRGINYLMVGENLFKGTNITEPVPVAVEGWMQSPGHRQNILTANYTETGIGIWQQNNTYYFTQVFLRPVF